MGELLEFGLDILEDCQLFGVEETFLVGDSGIVLLDVVEVVEYLLYLVLCLKLRYGSLLGLWVFKQETTAER